MIIDYFYQTKTTKKIRAIFRKFLDEELSIYDQALKYSKLKYMFKRHGTALKQIIIK